MTCLKNGGLTSGIVSRCMNVINCSDEEADQVISDVRERWNITGPLVIVSFM